MILIVFIYKFEYLGQKFSSDKTKEIKNLQQLILAVHEVFNHWIVLLALATMIKLRSLSTENGNRLDGFSIIRRTWSLPLLLCLLLFFFFCAATSYAFNLIELHWSWWLFAAMRGSMMPPRHVILPPCAHQLFDDELLRILLLYREIASMLI